MFGRTLTLGAIAFALCALSASACNKSQTETTIPTSWRNPDFSGEPFQKFFVIGVGRSDAYRRLYEDSMVRALEGQGAVARASWTLFPDEGKLDKARVLVTVEEQGFGAVVIARLRSVNNERKFVAARPMTSSDLYMSGYDEAYAVNSEPAHYETDKVYRVETSVYSARDELLAWLVLSDTVNPDSVEDVIESVSSAIATRMKAEGLIGSR